MKELLVLKIGGSILDDEKSVKKATDVVEDVVKKGFSVVVIASALKGVTDKLLTKSRKSNPNASPETIDRILSTGERESVRLLTDAICARKIDAIAIDPDSPYWPMMTDGNHLDAEPLYDKTEFRVEEGIRPLIEEGKLPVICGFLGRSPTGEVTTMGRGGSDTTAVIIGRCLRAKEIILVKDVDAIFSSDPDKVDNPVPIEVLDSEEAYALASGGAKFLHAKALRYVNKGVRIRIASISNGIFHGTVIDGKEMDIRVEKADQDVSMITIIGVRGSEKDRVQLLMQRCEDVGGKIISLTFDSMAMVAYVSGGVGLLNHIHDLVVNVGYGKAVTDFGGLTMIVIKGRALETSPGMIQRTTQPLARDGINVYGVITIASSIRIFVSKDQEEKAITLLKTALEVV